MLDDLNAGPMVCHYEGVEYIDAQEAAYRLRVVQSTVYRLVRREKVRAFNLSPSGSRFWKKRYFRANDIEGLRP